MQKHKIFVMALTLVLIFSFSVIASAGKYNEAPMLAAREDLPPIEERLPVKPLIVEPLEEIGEYGGTLYVYTTAAVHLWDGEIIGMEFLLGIEGDYSWGVPNIVENYKWADDAKSITLYLREGMKWSDGHPFTADDFLYWYEYEFLNEEVYSWGTPAWLQVGEGTIQMTKIDNYTVRVDFPQPYSLYLNYISHAWGSQNGIAGATGVGWYGSFQAAHYAKQFHVDFIGKEKAAQMAEEAGFATWIEHYARKTTSFFGLQFYPDSVPTLGAYTCKKKTIDEWVFERNPYYWKVDTEGNQLPYIDRVILRYIGDIDVITGKIIAGECDYAGLAAQAHNLPLYVDNAEEGGYRVLVWRWPGNEHIELNLTSEDPVLREIFQDIQFRQAMSLAINREEVNKILYFGLATPASYTVPPGTEYYKEEYANAYIEYDPERANELLDEVLSLKNKDEDGYRLRPDGERLTITLEAFEDNPIYELVVEYCKDIGIDVRIKIETFALFVERSMANLIDMRVESGEFNIEPAFSTLPQYYVPMQWGWTSGWGVKWDQWYQTGGTEGEEPPEKIMNLINWYKEMKLVVIEEERIELAQKILKSHADNLWMINIVTGTPQPIIVKENLRNIPAKALYTWDMARIVPFSPEQFFLKGE